MQHILIVSNDNAIIAQFEQAFSCKDIDLVKVNSYFLAKKAIALKHFDLIIMPDKLSDINGTKIAISILGSLLYRLPFIFIVQKEDQKIISHCITCGTAVDFIVLPISNAMITQKLDYDLKLLSEKKLTAFKNYDDYVTQTKFQWDFFNKHTETDDILNEMLGEKLMAELLAATEDATNKTDEN